MTHDFDDHYGWDEAEKKEKPQKRVYRDIAFERYLEWYATRKLKMEEPKKVPL